MFSTDRNQLRQVFFDAWQKHQKQLPLAPVEAQLIDIMLLHPEYHLFLDNPEAYQLQDFNDVNPFLHMSLHLAICEQVTTNRPAGITEMHQALCHKFQDRHIAEHRMMDCLADILWQAQQSGQMPDEKIYLENLRGVCT